MRSPASSGLSSGWRSWSGGLPSTGLQRVSAGQLVLAYSACRINATANLMSLCDSDALSGSVGTVLLGAN